MAFGLQADQYIKKNIIDLINGTAALQLMVECMYLFR